MMLKNSFGISDDEVALFLDADSNDYQFASQDEIDFALLEQFGQCGEDANNYEVLTSKIAREAEYFADVKQLTELEANVLNLIKKDKRITPEVIAATLKQDTGVIGKVMQGLTDAGILALNEVTVGDDKVIERTATDVKIGGEKSTVTEIIIMYQYTGPKDDRNRPFCAKLMELNRLYKRSDIENISERLGYSVWDRRGGWFTQPDGDARPYCRHDWYALTVTKKK
jgi:hypothetical protein